MTDMDRFIEAADALAETTQWQIDAIRKSITDNGLDKHRLILGDDVFDGPVVNWIHDVLIGFAAIDQSALTEYRAAREAITRGTPPAFATSA